MKKTKKKINQDTIDQKVVGLTLEEAKKLWDDIRVIEEDETRYFGTTNFRPMRMNVIIKNGKITSVFNFG
jgi:hypothetical protein